MEFEEALKILERQIPCGHQCVDTSLGNGTTWAKCVDCGEVVAQSSLERCREGETKFDDAIAVVKATQKENADLHAQLEQPTDEGWRRSLEKLHKTNSDLRAQLARCVMYLKSIDDAHLQTIASKVALYSILDDLPKQAKADAEVLRCAEEFCDAYSQDFNWSFEDNIERKLCNAVRAAKEVKGGR